MQTTLTQKKSPVTTEDRVPVSLRMKPSVYQRAADAAREEGRHIGVFVERCIEFSLQQKGEK